MIKMNKIDGSNAVSLSEEEITKTVAYAVESYMQKYIYTEENRKIIEKFANMPFGDEKEIENR